MREPPFLICFAGIDGSGKTTCAKMLLQDLRARGMPVKYAWLNPRPLLLTPLRLIARRTVLRGEDIRGDYVSYREKRQEHASKGRFLRKVYYGIMLLDYVIWVYWNLWPYVIRRSTITCDRYVLDLVVNLGEILGYSDQEEISLIRKLLNVLPKPSLVIVCDVDEMVALQRKSDTPHISYLSALRPRYRRIAEEFRFPVVDTSYPVDLVGNQIRQIVHEHMQV